MIFSSHQGIPINHHLKTKLEQSFQLTHDLVAHLEEESLSLDLPNLLVKFPDSFGAFSALERVTST
jgi:hypothetical protein